MIGVNADRYEDASPYRPALYNSGKSLPLADSQSIEGIDFAVGPPRTPATLHVKIVTPDGSPYSGASIRIDDLAGQQRGHVREQSDTAGAISAPVYVGERYVVKAFHYILGDDRPGTLEGSATVDVNSQDPTVTVVLQYKPPPSR